MLKVHESTVMLLPEPIPGMTSKYVSKKSIYIVHRRETSNALKAINRYQQSTTTWIHEND